MLLSLSAKCLAHLKYMNEKLSFLPNRPVSFYHGAFFLTTCLRKINLKTQFGN